MKDPNLKNWTYLKKKKGLLQLFTSKKYPHELLYKFIYVTNGVLYFLALTIEKHFVYYLEFFIFYIF